MYANPQLGLQVGLPPKVSPPYHLSEMMQLLMGLTELECQGGLASILINL